MTKKSIIIFIALTLTLLVVVVWVYGSFKPVKYPKSTPTPLPAVQHIPEPDTPTLEEEDSEVNEAPADAKPSLPSLPGGDDPELLASVEERVSELNIVNRTPLKIFDSTRFSIAKDRVSYAGYELTDADPATFSPLKSDYAKDKNKVYFRNAVVQNADPATFEVLGFNYGRDADSIFYENYEIEMETQEADVKPDYDSFEVLGEDYARDKYNVYCWGRRQTRVPALGGVFFAEMDMKRDPINEADLPWDTPCKFINRHEKTNDSVEYDEVAMKGVDVNTFVRLGNLYGADKDKIYCDFTELEGVDYKTFHSPIVNDKRFEPQRHAMDKNNVYYFCRKIEGADVNSFEIIPYDNLREPEYAIDANYVYFREFRIKGANNRSFEILGDEYSRDDKNIYYRERLLVGADYDSFTYEHGQAKDKYSRFQQGVRQGDENPEVEDLGGGYKKYHGHIYFHNREIEGVDLASFYYLEDDSWVAYDKHRAYFGGLQIKGIDLTTMEHLEYGYVIDKNHVYYVTWGEVSIIEGADPNTFQIVNYHTTRDANHHYYDGIAID